MALHRDDHKAAILSYIEVNQQIFIIS